MIFVSNDEFPLVSLVLGFYVGVGGLQCPVRAPQDANLPHGIPQVVRAGLWLDKCSFSCVLPTSGSKGGRAPNETIRWRDLFQVSTGGYGHPAVTKYRRLESAAAGKRLITEEDIAI